MKAGWFAGIGEESLLPFQSHELRSSTIPQWKRCRSVAAFGVAGADAELVQLGP